MDGATPYMAAWLSAALAPATSFGAHRPHEGGQEKRPTSRLVGGQVLGEGLELRRRTRPGRRRRPACRAAARARAGTPDRWRWLATARRARAPSRPRAAACSATRMASAAARPGFFSVAETLARRVARRWRCRRSARRCGCARAHDGGLGQRAISSGGRPATCSRARSRIAAAQVELPEAPARLGRAQPQHRRAGQAGAPSAGRRARRPRAPSRIASSRRAAVASSASAWASARDRASSVPGAPG